MLIEGMAEALEKTQKNIGIGPLLDLLIEGRPVPVAAHAARKSDRTRRLILDCANQLLISEGAHGFTLRAVADKAGLSQGNLTYHFASKRQLLEAMIDDRIADYGERFKAEVLTVEEDPRARIESLVRLLVNDLRTPEIGFFPQLWALGMTDVTIWERVQKIYDAEREIFVTLLRDIDPDMPLERAQSVALHIQSTIEGLTIFVGLDRLSHGPFADPAAEIVSAIDAATSGK